MVELHYHLDGGIRLDTCFDLYRKKYERVGRTCPYVSLSQLKKDMVIDSSCPNLSEALEKFKTPLKVLQDCVALERVAYEAIIDLHRDNVTYAEIRFAPYSHTLEGLSQLEAVEAVISGIGRGLDEIKNTMEVGLVLCMMRGAPREANEETLNLIHRLRDTIVCGLDIAGDEERYPLYMYMDLFKKAKEQNIPFTIHCGEGKNPMDIRIALDLGAKRLGHATCAIEHPELIEDIKKNDVLIECCVTSNYYCKGVKKLSDHPLIRLRDLGVKVIPCVDDPTIFQTSFFKERLLCMDIFHLTFQDLKQMDEWGYEHRFLTKK